MLQVNARLGPAAAARIGRVREGVREAGPLRDRQQQGEAQQPPEMAAGNVEERAAEHGVRAVW
ncbi:MAG: hypothetical protein ACJ8GO_18800 [Ramlibacter sp.]